MFLTSYVGAGRDATVVYGAIDFQFVNTRNFPIIIKSSAYNGINTVQIFGRREEVEYDIEISTVVLNHIPWRVITEVNNSLAEGIERVIQNGANGFSSVTYRIFRQGGYEVSREVLSRDIYDPMHRIIERGPIRR